MCECVVVGIFVSFVRCLFVFCGLFGVCIGCEGSFGGINGAFLLHLPIGG